MSLNNVKKFDTVLCASSIPNGNQEIYAVNSKGEVVKYGQRGKSAFDYQYTQMIIRRIAGKVLTIVDASYVNPKQLKAVKDLIRNVIAEELGSLWEASEQEWQKIIDDSVNALPVDYFDRPEAEASLEEVIGA